MTRDKLVDLALNECFVERLEKGNFDRDLFRQIFIRDKIDRFFNLHLMSESMDDIKETYFTDLTEHFRYTVDILYFMEQNLSNLIPNEEIIEASNIAVSILKEIAPQKIYDAKERDNKIFYEQIDARLKLRNNVPYVIDSYIFNNPSRSMITISNESYLKDLKELFEKYAPDVKIKDYSVGYRNPSNSKILYSIDVWGEIRAHESVEKTIIEKDLCAVTCENLDLENLKRIVGGIENEYAK